MAKQKLFISRQGRLVYFLIPSSIENNLIYLFMTLSQTGLFKNTVFRSS